MEHVMLKFGGLCFRVWFRVYCLVQGYGLGFMV